MNTEYIKRVIQLTSNRHADNLTLIVENGDVDIRREVSSFECRSEVFVPEWRFNVSKEEVCRRDIHIERVRVDVQLVAFNMVRATPEWLRTIYYSLSDGHDIIWELFNELIGLKI